jgi:hypothetical protein
MLTNHTARSALRHIESGLHVIDRSTAARGA